MSATTAPNPQTDHPASPSCVRLGRYTTPDISEPREIVSVPGAEGSTLVIDRRARTHADARLVGHLAADEPSENARIVAEMYLTDESKGRCRRVTAQDLELGPPTGSRTTEQSPSFSPDQPLLDPDGYSYRIREVSTDDAFPARRWTRSRHPGCDQDFDVLTLRHVIARLEDYEPARTLTCEALALRREDPRVSTCQLQCEFDRVTASPIVLNRGLREVVQRKVARGELSTSEIALRCGRVKRDRRGNVSGETSWLARRIGQLPEGGEEEPTRWVHSHVFALIVRQGLGESPHEIEIS
jgi:hypothetical protein